MGTDNRRNAARAAAVIIAALFAGGCEDSPTAPPAVQNAAQGTYEAAQAERAEWDKLTRPLTKAERAEWDKLGRRSTQDVERNPDGWEFDLPATARSVTPWEFDLPNAARPVTQKELVQTARPRTYYAPTPTAPNTSDLEDRIDELERQQRRDRISRENDAARHARDMESARFEQQTRDAAREMENAMERTRREFYGTR